MNKPKLYSIYDIIVTGSGDKDGYYDLTALGKSLSINGYSFDFGYSFNDGSDSALLHYTD